MYLPGGEELTLTTATGAVKATRYYTFNGQNVAVRTGNTNASVSSLVSDPHATAELAIANTTNLVTQRRMDPYGTPRGTASLWPSDRGFLNKPVDSSGLTQVGARYYDASIGRFISVDPVMALGIPQQWAAYSYADNNPISKADPTGMLWDWAKKTAKSAWKSTSKFVTKYQGEIVGTLVGVVVTSGCLAVTAGAGSIGCMALGGAAAGAATNLWKSKVQQVQPFGWRSLLMDTGVGALGGAVGGAAGKALAPIAGKALAKASVAGKAALGKAGTAIKSGVNAIKGGKAASTAARACSSSAPTLVLMGDGSTRPISQIAVGDEVTATDPETGEQAAKKVLQIFVHTDDLVNLEVAGEVLETTEDHPFWNVTDQAFQRADELDAGDQLLTADGKLVTVRGIREAVTESTLAYNLSVDDIHTYYVVAGTVSILVHNSGSLGPGQIHLWRGVTANELADISANRAWSSPHGVKYVSFTERGAAEYSRRAYAAYPKEGPYTMIRTTVNAADLPDGARMAYTADVIDSGVALNDDGLKILGRPSIMTSMSTGVSCAR